MTKMTNQFIEERWSITNSDFEKNIKKAIKGFKAKDFKPAKLEKEKTNGKNSRIRRRFSAIPRIIKRNGWRSHGHDKSTTCRHDGWW